EHMKTAEKDTVDSVFTVNGFSFAGRGQNAGLVFVKLKPYEQRQRASQKVAALIERTAAHYSRYKDAVVIPFNPPSIPELGTA
ncbi:efflux RND transporter permease subunit, partial [Arthrobacter sp. SIMBA_036]